MVKTVDAHRELPQARLFEMKELVEKKRQPLNDPVWTDVYDHLRAGDPVLGLCLDRRAWALPWWIMRHPHVANLLFEDGPVVVTLCVMSSSASAFRAEIGGQRLDFKTRTRRRRRLRVTAAILHQPIAHATQSRDDQGVSDELGPLRDRLRRQ